MVEPRPNSEASRTNDEASEKLLNDYNRISRGRRVRVAYLVVAVMAFGLSLVTGDALFISTSGLILVAALLTALILTRRERRLASLIGRRGGFER